MTDLPVPDEGVALVAADADGMAALRPTREMLDAFAVPWREVTWPSADFGSFPGEGTRATVVASFDAALPAALARKGLLVVRVPINRPGQDAIRPLLDPDTANLPAEDAAFATVALGEAGAKNAALFVVSVLGLTDQRRWTQWLDYRQRQTDAVLAQTLSDAP